MGKAPHSEKGLRSEVFSIALTGLVASLVSIVVTVEAGSSLFQLMGLAEASVRETRVRVLSALAQAGQRIDGYSIKVQVSPEGLRNDGLFDLAIATAVILALQKKTLPGTVVLGELSLSGAVRPVRGVLPALLGAGSKGIQRAIVPRGNLTEAASAPGIEVFVAGNLNAIRDHVRGRGDLERASLPFRQKRPVEPDLADVLGMAPTRRALEIAAAGHHALLFLRPPIRTDVASAARRLPTLLPPMSMEEALEVTSIHSVAGLLHADQGLITNRPFRTPHHSVSAAGLVGGGAPARPGEVSLAHGGVLFLDELPAFHQNTLGLLEKVLAQGEVAVVRGSARAVFPARPLLVAAAQACPCGGPLCERFDMQVIVSAVDVAQLNETAKDESSESVRSRVVVATTIQHMRGTKHKLAASLNGALKESELDRIASPDSKGKRLLTRAFERQGLSRSHRSKVLRVARTIADLAGSESVHEPHVAEAMQFAQGFTQR